jgi:hypothetical protein
MSSAVCRSVGEVATITTSSAYAMAPSQSLPSRPKRSVAPMFAARRRFRNPLMKVLKSAGARDDPSRSPLKTG